jgi:mannose-6-phosphate isomerase-like protein (cupin superfamily)
MSAAFDILAIARNFPHSAETMLIDTRLTDEAEASSRVFRVYASVPPHYHATCDEYLFVVTGRAIFSMGDVAPVEVSPGQLVFFKKGVVHAITPLGGEPLSRRALRGLRRVPLEATAEVTDQRVLDLAHGKAAARGALKGGHATVRNPTRDDQIEVTEVRVHVEGEAVAGDPA